MDRLFAAFALALLESKLVLAVVERLASLPRLWLLRLLEPVLLEEA